MIRIHLLQIASHDSEQVYERIERVSALVKRQKGADLVVLPELWSHGGFAYDEWQNCAEDLGGPTLTALSEAAASIGATVHAGSLIERGEGGELGRDLWNTSIVLDPRGRVVAKYRKIHRFGFGEGEPELLEQGDDLVWAPYLSDRASPVRLGLATCYDLRFPELFRTLADRDCGIFVIPAAWPAERVEHWVTLGRARALENQGFVIQCNSSGTSNGVVLGGLSQVVSPYGEIIAQAGTGEEVLVCDVNEEEVVAYRASFPVLADRRIQTVPLDN
ncbi:carbon-nitrogen family hydrolase [Nocardioides hungaricus]